MNPSESSPFPATETWWRGIILALDRNGAITHLNENGCTILGCSFEHVEGKLWIDTFIKESERDQVRSVFNNLMDGNFAPFSAVEGEVITCTGTVRSIRWYNTLLKGADGTITGVMSYGEDITGEKKVQDSLRKMQQFQESVIANANIWIAVLSPDRTILVWNEAAEAISGYKKSEVIGKKTAWTQLYPDKDYRRKVTGEIQRIIGRDKYLENFETEIHCADGSKKTIVWNTRGLHDNKGAITSFIAIGRDITEGKRAEEALRESEEKFRMIFEQSNDAIILMEILPTGLIGRIIDVNDVIIRQTGYTREELLSGTIGRIDSPDMTRKLPAVLSELLAKGNATFESEVVRKDGTLIPMEMSLRLVKLKEISYMVSVARDITERKQGEEAMKESKNLIDAVVDNVPLMIFLKEAKDLRFVLFNRAGEELLGYDREVLLGKNDLDLFPSEQATSFMTQDREVLDGEAGILDIPEEPIMTAKKGLRLLHTRKVCIRRADETTKFLLGISEDITERKRAETAIRESEEMYRSYIQNATEGVFVVDAAGRYLDVNPAACEMVGYTRGEMLQRTIADLVPQEYLTSALAVFEATKNTGRISIEMNLKKKDGSLAPVILNAVNLPNGKIMSFCVDITNRKREEEEREKIRSWQAGTNHILESILSPLPLEEKLKVITDGVVDIFSADFCRIWLIDKGDRCSSGCMHAEAAEGPHACRYRDKCLHLKASSGRYTHIDGKAHRRVPFGSYKIGLIASGNEVKFLTNDVEHDPRVHDHKWAKSLGLVAFSGYRLKPPDGEVLGVFALFTRFAISPDMDAILEGLSRAISLSIQKEVTDRALKESETQLNDVSEMAHVGGWELDVTTRGVRWTKETYRIHEIPEGVAFDLSHVLNFFDIPDRSRLETALQRGMEYGESFDLELPLTSARGRHIWTRTLGRAVKTDGNIVKLTGTFQDITDRRLAEDALRESRQLFSDIISFLPDPTFVIDKYGTVLAWNRALEKHSNVSAGDMIGKGDHEYSIWQYGKRRPILIDLVLHPDQNAGREKYSEIHVDGHTLTAQTEIIQKGSGHTTSLLLVASPLIDAQGKITGAIESIRDISRLKETEAELSRINQNLETIVSDRTRALEDEVAQRVQAEMDVKDALKYTRSVIEANPDLVTVIDSKGKIMDVNAATESLTGVPREKMIGTPYFSYLVDDGTLNDAFSRLFEKGMIENKVQVRRNDGHITPLSINATLIRGTRATDTRIIVAGHDITRQNHDEESIKASLDEKILLLREVHHRVKNNLQIIISLVNLQNRRTANPEVKQILSETQNRVRAMSLVHEKLYRSDSLSAIDFADYTRFLATQLFSSFSMDTRRVRLDFAMDKIMVDIDTAIPLGLLMNELISNSLKHAFPDGRKGAISISSRYEGDLITLVVRDNGIGIPKELDWKSTTSLGMLLVTRLVDQVDGTVTLDRENGTMFTLKVKRGSRQEKTDDGIIQAN